MADETFTRTEVTSRTAITALGIEVDDLTVIQLDGLYYTTLHQRKQTIM